MRNLRAETGKASLTVFKKSSEGFAVEFQYSKSSTSSVGCLDSRQRTGGGEATVRHARIEAPSACRAPAAPLRDNTTQPSPRIQHRNPPCSAESDVHIPSSNPYDLVAYMVARTPYGNGADVAQTFVLLESEIAASWMYSRYSCPAPSTSANH